MKLATIRLSTRTAAVRIDDGEAIETGHNDVGALLAQPDWLASAAAANGPRHVAADLNYAAVVPHPEKIVCVGLITGRTSWRWAASCPSTQRCSQSFPVP